MQYLYNVAINKLWQIQKLIDTALQIQYKKQFEMHASRMHKDQP